MAVSIRVANNAEKNLFKSYFDDFVTFIEEDRSTRDEEKLAKDIRSMRSTEQVTRGFSFRKAKHNVRGIKVIG